jgi:ribosome-associated translation inhibitor RaiA
VELEIRMVDVDHVEALRTYLQRRIRFALGRVSRSIRRVTVRVADGTPGGLGVEVRITLDLLPAGRIVLIEQAPELHAAIDSAVDRLARAIARRMDRGRAMGLGGVMPRRKDR